jgi:hypothetical protein
MTFPSAEIKQESIQDQSLSIIGMWGSCVPESTASCNNKQARFHNAERLCEGIITQKCFVKKIN